MQTRLDETDESESELVILLVPEKFLSDLKIPFI